MSQRTPRDMRALLKFCMESTKSEDAPESLAENMDPERQEWLRKALEHHSVDVIQQLGLSIERLSDESVVSNADADDLEAQEEALDCVEDWTEQIDLAMNFHQLGGFVALKLCLRSPHHSLVAGSANAVAVLAQNNPYCQDHLLADDFLPLLLGLLDKDESPALTKVKAMYALSSMARDHECGRKQLLERDGLSVLVRAVMQPANARLRTKACFFLTWLLQQDAEAKAALTKMGLAQQLVAMLRAEHDASHEHVMNALLALVTDNDAARDEAAAPELGLEQLLRERIGRLQGKEEFDEERQYAKDLRAICFAVAKGKRADSVVDR